MFARGGPVSAFELVTDHSCSAADAPLLHRAAMRGIESVPDILRLNMKAIDVVKPAVPCLGDNRQTPPVAGLIGRAVLNPPCNDRVARHSNAMRVCDNDRSFEKSALLNPGRASHFAVAIQAEKSGVNRIVQRSVAARKIAVTPVRTGPLPTSSFPSPLINVV